VRDVGEITPIIWVAPVCPVGGGGGGGAFFGAMCVFFYVFSRGKPGGVKHIFFF